MKTEKRQIIDRKKLKITTSFLIVVLIVSFFSLIFSDKNLTDSGIVTAEKIKSEEKKYSEKIDLDTVLPDSIKDNITEKALPEFKGYVAIIMDDLGYGHENRYNLFEKLKGFKLTMSIIPHTHNAVNAEKNSTEAGFENMLHIPMQAKGLSNQYENEIRVDMKHDELYESLENMLSSFESIKGANNHMGSMATADKKTMVNVLAFLKKRNLFFIDSLTTNQTVVEEVSNLLDLEYHGRDIFLDNIAEENYIRSQFEKVKSVAARKGYAIAICHAREKTIETLQKILPELENSGEYKLVFVSELIKDKKKFSVSKL
ncbi:MAG: divergent polysaccharide deacetylase family protein [Candidatus Muiribacteriota bacterium]